MERDNIFDFKIGAYTPRTIPMNRLAMYLKEYASLLGSTEAVHFEKLRLGSTVLRAFVDDVAIEDVECRVGLIGDIDAPPELKKINSNINKLLWEDNAKGAISRKGFGTIIKFPGIDSLVVKNIGPIDVGGELEGEIVCVGGKDVTKHIHLRSIDDEIYKLETTDTVLAKEFGAHIFTYVRVFGNGVWNRNEDGKWVLEKFKVARFEAAQEHTLQEAVARLRSIGGTGWATVQDPLATWKALRGH